MPGELSITQEIDLDMIRVVLAGEVDIYNSQTLKDRLYDIIDSSKSDIRIDCNSLDYIDSTGLGVFVGALKKAAKYEKKIYLKSLKENIKKLFIITGLEKVFIIEE